MKRTYQPKNRQEKKGRNVLKARRAKGRKKLTA